MRSEVSRNVCVKGHQCTCFGENTGYKSWREINIWSNMMTSPIDGNIFRATVRGIDRSPVHSPHKGQWREALLFSLICAWINGWVNNGETSDLRPHRAHYDASVIKNIQSWFIFMLTIQNISFWLSVGLMRREKTFISPMMDICVTNLSISLIPPPPPPPPQGRPIIIATWRWDI